MTRTYAADREQTAEHGTRLGMVTSLRVRSVARMFTAAAAIAVGAGGPWALARGAAPEATATAGWSQGSGLAIVCVACVLVLLALGCTWLSRFVCTVAATWCALVLYTLPGTLTAAGNWEAHLAWGAYVSALGWAGMLVVVWSARGLPERTVAHRGRVRSHFLG